MRHTTCSTCRHDVPAARWCNWCGAVLAEPPAPTGRPRRPRGALAGVGLAAVLGVGAVAVASGVGPDGGASPAPSAVVLAEDAPAPPPVPTPTRTRSTVPSTPPGERVDVICSDLRVRSVPVDTVTTDVPGELVELANGTCVVTGPEGAVAP